MMLALIASLVSQSTARESEVECVAFLVTLVPLALMPYLFLASLVRARMIQSGAVGELIARLNEAPRPGELREALARALGDNSLELVYWLPEDERFVDARRAPLRAPARRLGARGDQGRARGRLHRGDRLRRLAARRGRPLPRGRRGRGARPAERAARGRAARQGPGGARIARSGCFASGSRNGAGSSATCTTGPSSGSCRWRSTCASPAPSLRDDPDAADRLLVGAGEELDAALGELRELARGIHPAVLSDRGLDTALETLARRAPVPVELETLPGERLPEAVELAAYFVVAEALTNVAKYAEASHAIVDVDRVNGRLVVSVDRRRRGRRQPRERNRPARAGRSARGDRGTPRHRLGARPGNDHHGEDPLRVVVADDSVLLREGVVRLLEEWGFDVVGQAGDADDLLRKVNAHKPDVAVVDIRMPPTNTDDGLRAALQIRAEHPGHQRARPLAVRRGGLRARAGRRRRGRGRLPAQGPRGGRRALHRRGQASGGGRLRARPRGRRRSWSAARGARTRSRSSRRASARCSS